MIEIVRVNLSDLDALQKISRETFYETFAAVNTEEDMRQYLEESLGTERLTQELSEPSSEFYFAKSDNKLIGYLKLNLKDAQTVNEDENALEIERIYLFKAFHGSSLGQQVFNFALQRARVINAPFIWLGVWEENPRAIAFYTKNGFVKFGQHAFILGQDEQTDILMKLKL
jgi:ribosomal protein S18 acetylase RimI-like enzyme